MNNVMKINGHTTVITFDPDIEMFRGEFTGLNSGADFYAYSIEGLSAKGLSHLKFFLMNAVKTALTPTNT